MIAGGIAGGREPVGLFFAIDLVVHLLLNTASSSRLSLWRPAPQDKLLLCVNVAGPGWASPEKRSRPAHDCKRRPRSWQRSARWYQAFCFFFAGTRRSLSTAQQQSAFTLEAGPTRETTALCKCRWSWVGFTREAESPCPRVEGPTPQLATKRSLVPGVLYFSLMPGARWYPTLKPRQFFHTKTKKHTYVHTKTKISRTPRQTDGQFFFPACSN